MEEIFKTVGFESCERSHRLRIVLKQAIQGLLETRAKGFEMLSIIFHMKRFTINKSIKAVLVVVGIYEALLATNFLLAAVFTPIMFFMGSDANPSNVPGSSVLIGLGMMVIFWICTPLSFVLNWYMVFSKKADYPKWFLWLIPLPFIGLLGLGLIGLGLKPFIPFAFN